jgi:hypothetical protein
MDRTDGINLIELDKEVSMSDFKWVKSGWISK